MTVYQSLEEIAVAIASEKGGPEYEGFIECIKTAPPIAKMYTELFFDFVDAHGEEIKNMQERKEA
ncbi:MAG: hypothetical protein R3Y11_08520 [Pseudomonadota bacterium]